MKYLEIVHVDCPNHSASEAVLLDPLHLISGETKHENKNNMFTDMNTHNQM